MNEHRSKGPKLRADGGETTPASRYEDDRAAAASPEEATQRVEVRRFLNLLIASALISVVVDGIAAIAVNSPRWFGPVIVGGLFAAWVAVGPRRAVDHGNVEAIVDRVAIVLIAWILAAALFQPFLAFALTPAYLVPIAFALAYLEGRKLRLIMGLAWVAAVCTTLVHLLPDDSSAPAAVKTIVELVVLGVVIGVVFIVLYRSAEGLKASGREFRRLLELSSDLAETTDPGVLGGLVARHLAAATGFDDCVIYALAPETGRLAPFGSHPVERSLETAPESIAQRPMLERVARDRAPIVIDVSDKRADPLERDRLRALGRMAMLLLPLTAQERPVGIAELTSAVPHSIDVRRLALARTLTFEAAMAIENGRLYQELRDQSLHDPLTGLANRSLFYDRAEHTLARQARKEGAGVAVLFMDLDGFKTINDTLGHARGDRLLTLVGERLRSVTRAADTVARLGGDEFAVLLEDVSSVDAALVLATRAIDSLAQPFDLGGQSATTSVSIGVAFRSAQGATIDDLLQDADAAMYEAKAAGKGRTVLSAGSRIAPALGRAAPTAG
jgi:diguanylate cyclase (GGDEF)-like protein